MRFGNQWQIPHWETGAPGLARFAEAVVRGEVQDALSPTGERRALFVFGNIPNHGVLGRQGAAGYLTRSATELETRGLDATPVREAAAQMQRSSEVFQALRYESDLARAGVLLTEIARHELAALDAMRAGWETVRQL